MQRTTFQKQLLLNIDPDSPPDLPTETHTYASGPQSTSTFRVAISELTNAARGGGNRFNPSIEPYQDSILKKFGKFDLDNAEIREEMYETSNLIRMHTFDQVWKVVAQGWDYLSADKCEACASGDAYQNPELCTCEKVHKDVNWTKQLEDVFIEAFSRALAIDTAFITRWANGRYDWWTRNDVWRSLINEPFRDIEEVYFRYGRIDKSWDTRKYKKNRRIATRHRIVGFLTQYAEDDERTAELAVLANNTQKEMITDTVYRDCVVIQPCRDVRRVYGQSRHRIEMDTAAQKKYLRSAEMIYVHHGGKKRTIAAPSGGNSTVKDALVRDVQRGVFSAGVFLDIERLGNQSINDMVMVSETQSGPMPFADLNGMINEDAQLTKQSVQGAAESGALGGQSPVVNERRDEVERDRLFLDMEEAIRAVNEVFFGIEQYTEEIKTNAFGRPYIERQESYRIRFRTSQFIKQPDAADPEQQQQLQTSNKQPISQEYENGVVIEAHSVALTKNATGFITFTGNSFQAGVYKYPERKTERWVTYTPEQIEEVTQEPIKTHYLELNHSDSLNASFGRNIGYSEIIGYDPAKAKDISRYHIRAELEAPLKDKGIIYQDKQGNWTIDVSPRFVRSFDPVKKRDRLFLKNNAVVDPNTSMPRARLTGLDTSAKMES